MFFKSFHKPILVNQLLKYFNLSKNAVVLDGTLGFSGHAEAILTQYPLLHYYGFDKDEFALKKSFERCGKHKNFKTFHMTFSKMLDYVTLKGVIPTHILLDLGVSSYQLDKSGRGFTFQLDESLDMRMDLNGQLTAKRVLNEYDSVSLTNMFLNYGDIHNSERLVRNIINQRSISKISTTFDLKNCVKGAFKMNSRSRFISMLTKVFQAVRIEVNQELNDLDCFLTELLKFENITVAIITFQPNEDRRVKTFVKENGFEKITKKPIQMSYHECKENPRGKTAKLRIFNI